MLADGDLVVAGLDLDPHFVEGQHHVLADGGGEIGGEVEVPAAIVRQRLDLAAFGLEQLKKLPQNLTRRRRNFDRYTEYFAKHGDRFSLPRQLDHLETAWLGYPLMIDPAAGFVRGDLQRFLDDQGIDTRTVWTGNVTRQPMLAGIEVRVPSDGLPVADDVMTRGVLLPLSHALDDETLDYVTDTVSAFLATR